MKDNKDKQLKGGIGVQSIATTSVKPTTTYTNTLNNRSQQYSQIPNRNKVHYKNQLSLKTNNSNLILNQ